MKSVFITGVRQCELREVPEPKVRAPFVRVKIHAAPMCTEVNCYRNGETDYALGHEAAGEVVEVGKSTRVQVGDRVAVMPQTKACGRCALCLAGNYMLCENTFDPLAYCESPTGLATYAEYWLQQDWLLLPLPDDISYDHGAMACCGLGPTFGAMQLMKVNAYDTVIVAGLGAVGLGAVINASARSYSSKVTFDRSSDQKIEQIAPKSQLLPAP